jgi:hypothetical protein
MKKASVWLAPFGGLALFALAWVAPALADPGRHHHRQWDPQQAYQSQENRRDRRSPKIGRPQYRDFDKRWSLYFGPGPNSYECIGYDCNW